MNLPITQPDIPKTAAESLEQKPPLSEPSPGQVIDISLYYSKETLVSLTKAVYLAKSLKRNQVTLWHLLYTLISQSNIQTTETTEKLIETTNQVKEIMVKENKGVEDYQGMIFFSPELKKVLFGAYFVSRQKAIAKVTNQDLLEALLSVPEVQSVFPSESFSLPGLTTFSLSPILSQFAIDLTNKALEDKELVLQREDEIEPLLRILAREEKHHLVLLGEVGVGKETMGLALAKFLAVNKVPNFLETRVILLDVGEIFTSSPNVNFYVPKILEEVEVLPKTIFFLSNTTLINDLQGFSLLVNFIRSLEKAGQFYFILPLTPSYYNGYCLNNSYLNSSFEVIKVGELSLEETETILSDEAQRIEKHHQIKIDTGVIKETAFLAKRYLSGSLPQKAIALLEEVVAGCSLIKASHITSDDVRKIVAQKTGIPLASITLPERERLKNLEALLKQYVIGQDEAVRKVVESLQRARVGLKDPRKPIGSFLFLGPTGVGKTELAKVLAKIYFNDEKAFFRFDMSEYSESHTAQRLTGPPPGYVGYEEGGQLTNLVSEKPYSLLLFDEIEKAHARVFDLFLQILDDGRLTDGHGRTVDFKNTLIIFTSNIGAEEIFMAAKDLNQPDFDRKKFYEETIIPLTRKFFRPEFLNRFDDIVFFNPLTKEQLVKIAQLKIKQLADRLSEKGIKLDFSLEKIVELVDDSYDPSFGARPLERAIKEKVENTIAQKMISGEIKEGGVTKWE